MFSPSITSTKREPIFSFLFESKYLFDPDIPEAF